MLTVRGVADDKQKKLLQSGSGHFSMIKWEEMVIDRSNMAADPINRALHLADLITELNGTFTPCLLLLQL